MPHFDEFYADKLRGGLGVTDAESVLDLQGVSRERAEASIQDMLERSRFATPKSVAIRLDPPPEGGGETLFQPVGKALLDAKKPRRQETRLDRPAADPAGAGRIGLLCGAGRKAGAGG